MPRRPVTLYLLLLPIAGCARHGAVQVAPDESRPRISWEIRTGGDDGDADFVCGTSQPEKACVLAASTGKPLTLATAHLFLHAAARPTSYLGFMRGPFFEGEADRKFGEVNTTVDPGSRPVGVSVNAGVTSKPGRYPLTIAVDAMQPDAPNPVHLSQEVAVVVR